MTVLPFPFIYFNNRNNVNFMIYWKLLNYFEKILKYGTPPKFGRPRMRFILIIYGTIYLTGPQSYDISSSVILFPHFCSLLFQAATDLSVSRHTKSDMVNLHTGWHTWRLRTEESCRVASRYPTCAITPIVLKLNTSYSKAHEKTTT